MLSAAGLSAAGGVCVVGDWIAESTRGVLMDGRLCQRMASHTGRVWAGECGWPGVGTHICHGAPQRKCSACPRPCPSWGERSPPPALCPPASTHAHGRLCVFLTSCPGKEETGTLLSTGSVSAGVSKSPAPSAEEPENVTRALPITKGTAGPEVGSEEVQPSKGGSRGQSPLTPPAWCCPSEAVCALGASRCLWACATGVMASSTPDKLGLLRYLALSSPKFWTPGVPGSHIGKRPGHLALGRWASSPSMVGSAT